MVRRRSSARSHGTPASVGAGVSSVTQERSTSGIASTARTLPSVKERLKGIRLNADMRLISTGGARRRGPRPGILLWRSVEVQVEAVAGLRAAIFRDAVRAD